MNKVDYGGHQKPNSGPPRGRYGSAFYRHSRLKTEWQQEGGRGGKRGNSTGRKRMGEVRSGVGKRSPEWRVIKGPPLYIKDPSPVFWG